MKNEILFINPPNHAESVYVPIGLNILEQLCKKAGIKTSILDIQTKLLLDEISWPKNFFAEYKQVIKNYKSKIYAFTVMNVGFPWSLEMARIIKEIYPNSIILFGGPHMTLVGEKVLKKYSFIDYVSQYEGEKIIVGLVRALLKGDNNSIQSVKNMIYRDGKGNVIFTERESLIQDLDTLPNLSVETNLLKNIDLLSIEAGRGCPFHCYFCSSHTIWTRQPRFKSPQKLISEVKQIEELRPEDSDPLIISFEHDNFLADKSFLNSFVEYKIQSNEDFKYVISGSINLLSDSIIKKLQKSGCISIFMGLETGSQRVQKISKKKLDINSILPIVSKVINSGIHVSSNLIIGYPEETFNEMIQTIDLAIKLNFCGAKTNISMMCPEPGSELHNKTNPEDYIMLENNQYYQELVQGGINPHLLDPVDIFHLLTIKNPSYDIVELEYFSKLILLIAENFPVTLFLTMDKNKVKLSDIWSYYFNNYDRSTNNKEVSYLRSSTFLNELFNTFDNSTEIILDCFNIEKQKWLNKHSIIDKEGDKITEEKMVSYYKNQQLMQNKYVR